jgi:hypothetical protein
MRLSKQLEEFRRRKRKYDRDPNVRANAFVDTR